VDKVDTKYLRETLENCVWEGGDIRYAQGVVFGMGMGLMAAGVNCHDAVRALKEAAPPNMSRDCCPLTWQRIWDLI
jgi:hypothetical protein